MIAYKFVKWDINPLETLKDSTVYRLKVKAMGGQKMTREEKDWLARNLALSTYGRSAIALMGWMFNFYGYVNRYLVKQYNSWTEYYAPDRTSLRKALYGRIQELHELPKAA